MRPVRIETLPVDMPEDAPVNANRMAPAKYAALRESIRRIGFVVPLVVVEIDSSGNPGSGERRQIVDGHHRRRAARELGLVDVACVVCEAGEDPRVVALALNRLRGETDLATAGAVIEELMAVEGMSAEDLGITGFSARELESLVAAINSADEEPDLSDASGVELPDEVGTPALRPFLLELTFRTKEELTTARKALRKAAGRGNDLADGLLRLATGE